MNLLPPEIAEAIKESAWQAAVSVSNERFGKTSTAKEAKAKWQNSAQAMKKAGEKVISPETCEDLKNMFWRSAWHTSNTRKGYDSDAKKDIGIVEECYDKICKRNEFSGSLASNLKDLGLTAGWYWAHNLKGDDEAGADKAKFEAVYEKIAGEVKLVDIKFLTDKAKLLGQKPIVASHQTFVNDGDLEQSNELKFSFSEGTTSSWSNTFGFKFGVTAEFSAGFPLVAKAKYALSLDISDSQSFSGGSSQSKSKDYTYPLKVPPHSTYEATATINEAQMDVPYEMIYDFGGKRISLFGTWKGVATSEVNYVVKPVKK